jgi:hypothetical protein
MVYCPSDYIVLVSLDSALGRMQDQFILILLIHFGRWASDFNVVQRNPIPHIIFALLKHNLKAVIQKGLLSSSR